MYNSFLKFHSYLVSKMPPSVNILEFLKWWYKKDGFFKKRCLSDKKKGGRQVTSLGTTVGHNLITLLLEDSPLWFSHSLVCLAGYDKNMSAWLISAWARVVVSASNPEEWGNSYPRRKGRLVLKALHSPGSVFLGCRASLLHVQHLSGTLCIVPTDANADIHAACCTVSNKVLHLWAKSLTSSASSKLISLQTYKWGKINTQTK